MKKGLFRFGNELNGKLAGIKDRYSPSEIEFSEKPSSARVFSIDTNFYTILKEVEAGNIRIGYDSKKDISVAEVIQNGKVSQIAICEKNGDVKLYASEQSEMGAYIPYSEKHRGTVLKAAHLGMFASNREVYDAYKEVKEFLPLDDNANEFDDPIILDMIGKNICILTNIVYYDKKENTPGGMIDFDYELLRQSKIKSVKECEFVPAFGSKELTSFNGKKKKEKKSVKYQKGCFALSSEPIEEKYRHLIPEMPESYVVPPLAVTIARTVKELKDINGENVRNILLSGESGTGKTQLSRCIASFLGLPYFCITCSPDMDFIDLVGQMLPNIEKMELSELFNRLDLPTAEDIDFDFEASFERLYGKKPGQYDSPSDCYSEVIKRALSGVSATNDFTFVKSGLIESLQNGFLCEIQEANIVKRSSVLVSLNSIMEPNGTLTLSTGEMIKRHPNAVIIYTQNPDYDGTHNLQESVLSRCQICHTVTLPSNDTLVERCVKNTGFNNKPLLKKMANVVTNINVFLRESGERGDCGPRELDNWAKLSILHQKWADEGIQNATGEITEEVVCESAFSTILAKLSAAGTDYEEILTKIFQKQFDQGMIETARTNYEDGLC